MPSQVLYRPDQPCCRASRLGQSVVGDRQRKAAIRNIVQLQSSPPDRPAWHSGTIDHPIPVPKRETSIHLKNFFF